MADAFFSSLVERLASIALQEADQEVRLVEGVDREVRKLTSNLQDIQAVIEDAERRQVKEATVKRWLDKLKDVCYDIDDVLDEWNSAILKMRIGGYENALNTQRKVCSFIPSSCFCYRQVELRRDIAIKIKQLNERLDVIANEKLYFDFTLMKGNEELERRKTASVIDVSEVYGRDHDKNKIVDMLLSESSQGPALRIISLVGMGGIGKTTLAQLIYNDDAMKAHFQIRIWVCVSGPFDELRIAKGMLACLTMEASNLNELESVLEHIHQSIEGKKFLLVLDDVWNEDSTKWEPLKNSLQCGSPGSRILVTTRKVTAAKIIGTTDIFQLGQLSNKECWLLFSHVAFDERSSEEREQLEGIGRKIAEKCKGLPLAAKTLGALLRFKKTREQWQSVLDSEVWELEEAERCIFPPLLLSYYDLSSTMRRCFSYCAIFPKDYEMEKDRLIKLWMAQGYLGGTHTTDMEMVGEECFRNLAMCFFFQDLKKYEDGTITCKMHDIVHDLTQFLTENECFVMEVNSPEELRLDSSYVKARHSMMMLAKTISIPTSIYKIKNLRSLIVKSKDLRKIGADLPKLFDHLTCLRTLDLSMDEYSRSSLKELPREVGKLTHLRNLNLAKNCLVNELPESVCDLFDLQSLNVTDCISLKNLPGGLGKLINLRHLEIAFSGISFVPKAVERLTSLRTLDTFYVSSDVNDSEVFNFEDLGNLNHLRGYLEILGLGKVRDVDEVKKAQLENKEHLIALALGFSGNQAEERDDERVIEAIQPPPNLEELSIVEYKGTVFPLWMMSLTELRRVQICRCENCELLPPLGKLPSLETLIIGSVKTKNLVAEGGMWRVKRVGIGFLGIETDVNKNEGPSSSSVTVFPKLKQLYFGFMREWEEWDYKITRRKGEEENITTGSTIIIMPHLCSLRIKCCPKLKALPDHLLRSTSLKELEISYCQILEERYYKEPKGEDWSKISHIPNIIINGKYVPKDGHLVPLIQDSADAMEPLLFDEISFDSEYPGNTVPIED